ncbi:MAG: exo-alpha-sialidase, partial [Bryobacteraceae bacterium]
KRGLIEPSLAAYGGRFYLTMRAEDDRGYVSISDDGLVWEKMRPWAWENGEAITTSTTQQRWLVFDGRLFLVYTRRTAENEKVIRWRAPLLMAEVDAKRMHLKRATEQVVFPLVPDARFGNFHAAAITEELACIFCTEETSKEMHYRGNTLLMRVRKSGRKG